VKLGQFSTGSEIFSKIGGSLKQGASASLPQGEWTPLRYVVENSSLFKSFPQAVFHLFQYIQTGSL